MTLRAELEPHIERITGTIVERRDNPSQYPGSSTLRLLEVGWISTDELPKPFSIGDKLVEEACEIARAVDRNNIILESSQIIYYVEVGLVKEGLTNQDLFRSIAQITEEQTTVFVAPDKIAEHTGAAIARIALAGVCGDRELLMRRSAEAIVGLNRFWEAHGISPTEVGEQI